MIKSFGKWSSPCMFSSDEELFGNVRSLIDRIGQILDLSLCLTQIVLVGDVFKEHGIKSFGQSPVSSLTRID